MSSSTLDHPAEAIPGQADSPRFVTGVLLIAAAILAATGAVWLSMVFGWPDILDAPGDEGLAAFIGAASAVRTAFYLMLLSSLLLIPAAIYLEQYLGSHGPPGRPGRDCLRGPRRLLADSGVGAVAGDRAAPGRGLRRRRHGIHPGGGRRVLRRPQPVRRWCSG